MAVKQTRRVPKPTATEERLGMSLPAGLRELPVEEVRAGQSLQQGESRPTPTEVRRGGGGGGGGGAPSFTPTPTEQVLQQSLPTELRELSVQEVAAVQSIPQPVQRTAAQLLQQSFPSVEARREAEFRAQQPGRHGGFQSSSTSRPTSIQETVNGGRTYGVVSAVPKPTTILGKTEEIIRQQRMKAREAGGISGGLRGTVAGIGATGLGIARAATSPIKTLKQIPSSVKEVYRRVKTGEGFPEVSRLIQEEPGYATGRAIGEVLIFKSPKIVPKTLDIPRTIGLKKIPTENVVAPEFFAGQIYPKISSGQTAGELLKEFRPSLPGEIKPAGFTASPVPFSKETKSLRGTSELPGVYQAPKLSPTFLRVGDGGREKLKLFSLNPFETSRPTAVRITPEEFMLVPGLRKGEAVVQPGKLGKVKEFFEVAPKGKSYVPFVKTEKEAIIPFETNLVLTGRRFFFKFEGRRIPILEFKTGKNIVTVTRETLPTVRQVSSKYYVGGKSKGLVDPLTFSYVYRRSGSKAGSISPSSSVYRELGSSEINSLVRPSGSSTPRERPSRIPPRFSYGSTSFRLGRGLDSPRIPKRPRIPGEPFVPRAPEEPRTPRRPRVPREPTTPFIPEVPRVPKKRISSSGIRIRGDVEELVLPFIKRYGKFQSIGQATTFEKAKGRGIYALRKTLGASLQVRGARTGKKIRIGRETSEFRLGSAGRDPFTVVQRAGQRLSRREEVMEIIATRRAGNVKFI